MFGTLKPVYNKMTSAEKRYYKMYYCGLCSSLGRLGGSALRMGLSYDLAFMYMILDLGNEKVTAKGNCPGRPLMKKECIDNIILSDYVAIVSLVLIYGKCVDNINDNEKILQSKLLLHIINKKISNIKYANSKIIDLIKNSLEHITEIERNFESYNYIRIADRFGILTGELFKSAPQIRENEVYYKLGYWLGRWIYIADAALDISEDKRSNRFNPFIQPKQMSLKDAINKYETEIANELFKAHDCVVDLLRLVDTRKNINEIINIISVSMDATEGNIFRKQEEIRNAK